MKRPRARRARTASSKVIPLEPRTMRLGIAEHFRVGERRRAKRVLEDMKALGLRDLRLTVSWADSLTFDGKRFYDWLLPTLAKHVSVVPCITQTPPSLGIEPRIMAPPREPRRFADWVDAFIAQHGELFDHVELWSAPNSLHAWDARLDPELEKLAATLDSAACAARGRGKMTVLGGLRPVDPGFLRKLAQLGVLEGFDVVALHLLPELSEPTLTDWEQPVASIRCTLEELGREAQVWITEGGFSTWRNEEGRQLGEFVRALESGVDRLYWCAMDDLPDRHSGPSGFHVDEREYALGLKRSDGSPKLLYRLWSQGGIEHARFHAAFVQPPLAPRSRRPTNLITGGAGFIGSNLANALLSRGEDVILLDNLARPGIERNVRWLREEHGDRMQLVLADVRDRHLVRELVRRADRVYHFAAQVAVTLSLASPRRDFDVNAGGTLNLLEALRELDNPPPLLFTSTNKVYGGLPDVQLHEKGARYEPDDPLIRAHGVSESRPLDFHSPYGCSKGVADQYILDYTRCFGIRAVVFRMSCIYGPRQAGNEEQGWVAHFLSQALSDAPITIYGDGLQVRDALYVGDLVDACLLAMERIDDISGHAFNVGGGPENTVSLIELLEQIGATLGRRPRVRFGAWRPGDQRYYCSDYRKLHRATGWKPTTRLDEGLELLRAWLAPRHLALASGSEP